MDTSLLGLYLKLNLLLAVTLLLWLATRSLARKLRFESSHAQQLKVARILFLALLGIAGVALLAQGWLAALALRMTEGVTVVAGIDTGLERDIGLGPVGFNIQALVLVLLLAGFAWQAIRLVRQVARLRQIVGAATEWRRIGTIHLLASSCIATPFSTRVLGRRQVVLPMALLASPHNLRLAVKHELQHVRNGDLEWVILLEAVKALCFWNPAAWFWHNEFDCLQEFACDETLVGAGHVTAQAYGNCLLEMASAHRGNALLAASNMVPRFAWLQDSQSQLKRRITLLTSSRRTRYQFAKSLAYVLLAGAGMMQAALVVFAADTDDSQAVVPLVRINPQYPQQALTEGLEGWVHMVFTISETGSVLDPLIVENCAWKDGTDPELCKPDDMFNTVALAALAKWKYAPKLDDGGPVAQEGVNTIIRFTLEAPRGEGCVYGGRLYPVGSTMQVRLHEPGDAPSAPRTVEGQTCVADPAKPGAYLWQY